MSSEEVPNSPTESKELPEGVGNGEPEAEEAPPIESVIISFTDDPVEDWVLVEESQFGKLNTQEPDKSGEHLDNEIEKTPNNQAEEEKMEKDNDSNENLGENTTGDQTEGNQNGEEAQVFLPNDEINKGSQDELINERSENMDLSEMAGTEVSKNDQDVLIDEGQEEKEGNQDEPSFGEKIDGEQLSGVAESIQKDIQDEHQQEIEASSNILIETGEDSKFSSKYFDKCTQTEPTTRRIKSTQTECSISKLRNKATSSDQFDSDFIPESSQVGFFAIAKDEADGSINQLILEIMKTPDGEKGLLEIMKEILNLVKFLTNLTEGKVESLLGKDLRSISSAPIKKDAKISQKEQDTQKQAIARRDLLYRRSLKQMHNISGEDSIYLLCYNGRRILDKLLAKFAFQYQYRANTKRAERKHDKKVVDDSKYKRWICVPNEILDFPYYYPYLLFSNTQNKQNCEDLQRFKGISDGKPPEIPDNSQNLASASIRRKAVLVRYVMNKRKCRSTSTIDLRKKDWVEIKQNYTSLRYDNPGLGSGFV